jgi:anhydro-N-acetylmuramic acid kinase
MRANDMKNGGQGRSTGASLPCRAARKAFQRPFPSASPVTFVNIGGISNITYVPEFGSSRLPLIAGQAMR